MPRLVLVFNCVGYLCIVIFDWVIDSLTKN